MKLSALLKVTLISAATVGLTTLPLALSTSAQSGGSPGSGSSTMTAPGTSGTTSSPGTSGTTTAPGSSTGTNSNSYGTNSGGTTSQGTSPVETTERGTDWGWLGLLGLAGLAGLRPKRREEPTVYREADSTTRSGTR